MEQKDIIPKEIVFETYKDALQPSLREVGFILKRTVKVSLAPLRGILYGFEKLEEMIQQGLEKRLERIPIENIHESKLEYAVPSIQALTYMKENETIRELFLDLLASSMDKEKDKYIHPSFVETIKLMDALDAKLFQKMHNLDPWIYLITPMIGYEGTNEIIGAAGKVNNEGILECEQIMPIWFGDFEIESYDIFQISSSIERLIQFGLLKVTEKQESDNHKKLFSSQILHEILIKFQERDKMHKLVIRGTSNRGFITDNGKNFAKICFDKKYH